jgi:alpha-glucosidase
MRYCNRIIVILFWILTVLGNQAALSQQKTLSVISPDARTEIRIGVEGTLTFSIYHNGTEIVSPSQISMVTGEGQTLGLKPIVRNSMPKAVKATIVPAVAEKRKIIPDVYHELSIQFKGDYGLKVRAYNDGVAYRFATSLPGELTVKHEGLRMNLAAGDSVWFPEEPSFLSHSERQYKFLSVGSIADTQMCHLPVVVVKPNGLKIAFSESDLLDYAGLYLRGAGAGASSLESKFPPYALEERLVGDRTIKVTKSADYIARTTGKREFPWRVFAIAEKDGDIIENDIIYRLGSPNKLKETSWIRPGKVAWDWWNASNLYGVSFKSGINTESYKHFIDFASKWKLEYVIFDEGWSKPSDLFEINPQMDMDGLFAYAKTKNVGIVLWVTSKALDDRMGEALDRFEKWGAKGIKVDFMQRDDQKMVNFYERTAVEAAKRHLLVDFHGSYKPTGLSRTYPNVVTREGVQGLEHSKWSSNITPQHDVTIPFIRMFAGAMDFTPGAMRNATKDNFRAVFTEPMSQGTRCHQLAMYVVYESPLQMLSDSPPQYDREPVIMEFLSRVPTTWDETKVLNASISHYVTVARKSGSDWYIGSMTNWTPRDFDLKLDFLEVGKYELTEYADGPNADKYAADYRRSSREVASSEVITIHLAPGGGWAAKLRKIN